MRAKEKRTAKTTQEGETNWEQGANLHSHAWLMFAAGYRR